MPNSVKFKTAVQRTSVIRTAYRPGIQALRESDRARITCKLPRKLAGSIDLDTALASSHPDAHRWDYGIGIREQTSDVVVWVEVHPATSGDVDDVCRKHTWLRQWLQTSAPMLDCMRGRYVWIASGRISIPANSPQRRKLALKGITFEGRTLHL